MSTPLAIPPFPDAAHGVSVVDAVAWDEAVATSENGESSTSLLRVEGMHCAACAQSLEAALMAVPGVMSATVSAATSLARIEWPPAVHVRLSSLAQAVVDAGYTPYPVSQAKTLDEYRVQQRRELWRLFVAGFCMMQVMMYAIPVYQAASGEITPDISSLLRWASWVLTLPVMLFSASAFFKQAWADIRHGRAGMDVPVALGIAITFAVSSAATFNPAGVWGSEVYFDSITMFVFFLLCGRYIEARARNKTAGALDALMQRMPRSVERFVGDWTKGQTERAAQTHLRIGDVVRVVSGQAVPGDGELLQGEGLLDEALLTGESKPLRRITGQAVLAGSVNQGQVFVMRLTRLGEHTRYAQIVQLMQRAATDKPAMAKLADRIAGPFVIAVLIAALAAGVVWWWIEPSRALLIAATVLIVTCPCALSLATPAAMLAAAGNLAKRGVLVQRLQAFETLAQVDHVVFDKTGTLTQDQLHIRSADAMNGISSTQTQRAVTHAVVMAAQSLHPVSRAIARFESHEPLTNAAKICELNEIPGQGISAMFEGDDQEWRLGSASFTGAATLSGEGDESASCYVACGGSALVRFGYDELIREDAANALNRLRAGGVNLSLLSGDATAAVTRVAHQLQLSDAKSACTPEEKLQFISEAQARGQIVAMVGDGINDAPVLAKADVSFALGDAADIARAQADFVVLSGRVSDVAYAQVLARRTLRIVKQNLAWAAVYNATCIPLALMGVLPAWLAGLGMACSSLLVVGNALRLTRFIESDINHEKATASLSAAVTTLASA